MPLPDQFNFDVFLSHSSKDKDTVHALAERLKKDGLRVWFDSWEIQPGDSIPAKIEGGLEASRILVLCMSVNAFGSDWAQLEAGTFRFRDPLNKERRFIPVRLDDSTIKGSLAQFLHLNWLPNQDDQAYAKLLEACRPSQRAQRRATSKQREETTVILDYEDNRDGDIRSYALSPNRKRVLSGSLDNTVRLWDAGTGRCLRVLRGHRAGIWSLAFSADQRSVLSASDDHTVRLWNVDTGRCLRILKGHSSHVNCVTWGPDQRHAISGSDDDTVRLWDARRGRCLKVFRGHTQQILSLAWCADRHRVLSGSEDNTIRLWEAETSDCLRVLEGHTGGVLCAAWSADQRHILSGSRDKTLRLWDVETGQCLSVLEGHTGMVWSLAWSADQRYALSGGMDSTVRLWDVKRGRCLRVLRGHTNTIRSVVWSIDRLRGFSADDDGNIRVWNLSELTSEHRPTSTPDQIQYTNAKVLLVGDSGVGKTGLANYLALGIKDNERNSSTDGAWATQWTLPHVAKGDAVDREIWLWDFAGQVDYRLVHQLFMDNTAAAVLAFNPQNENPFESLGQWVIDLQKATRKPFAKLLAAGRIDRGGLVVSRSSMNKFMQERDFVHPLHETSAKTGDGCDELREAVVKAIDWDSIPKTTSPVLYQQMKQEILDLRGGGLVLIRLAELKQRMELALPGTSFELAELETVVDLLAGPGMIQRLDFGEFILLRPEVLSRYAAAVVRKVRKHPQELGCIAENEMLVGELDYQDFERLPRQDEVVVLRALHETLVNRAWCFRQAHGDTAMLTFPSYFRRERPEQPDHPSVLVTYRFAGPVDEIYATLVVRLHHTEAFEADQLWKSAADFKTQTGRSLGFKLTREAEGNARLEVYFHPDVDTDSRVIFERYIFNHLGEYARDVVRLRHYACGNKKCDVYGQRFTDQAKVDKALSPGGKGKIFCPDCGKPIELRDVAERKFESPAVKEQARQMQVDGQLVIDNESRELLLLGHAFTIAAEAGQIFRPTPNSDHGIDGEIEFKDDHGRATGKRLYLQLKSGDSYLSKRQRDRAEVFQIKSARWATYWQKQAYPVMLVIRNSAGDIRWMDVSAYLKRTSNNGNKPVKQIVFEGERLDVMSIRRWREKALR